MHRAFFGSEVHLSSIPPRTPDLGRSSDAAESAGSKGSTFTSRPGRDCSPPALLRTGGLMRPLCQGFNVLGESPLLSKILHAILGKSILLGLSLFFLTLVHSPKQRRAGMTALLGGHVGRVN